MNERPTELTLNVMVNVWGTLDELVQTPTGDEPSQARRFREAKVYFSIVQNLARDNRSMPNFGDSETRRTYEQCIRFITMLEPLYKKYDLIPSELPTVNAYTAQDRT